MGKIIEEQKDLIDQNIRERILSERGTSENLPVTAMIFSRVSLGLGINLENACPYMRNCDHLTPSLCLEKPYRQCPYYQTNLALEIMEGKLDGLVTLG